MLNGEGGKVASFERSFNMHIILNLRLLREQS